jgi:hypothetical protein
MSMTMRDPAVRRMHVLILYPHPIVCDRSNNE